jgi:RHS repeat-associated protein
MAKPLPASCGDPSPLHFTGKQLDAETGNDDFGARYLGSNMARWLTPDWSAHAQSVPYGDLTNPQSLNLYAYVLNNPITHLDADGHAIGEGPLAAGARAATHDCDNSPDSRCDGYPSLGDPMSTPYTEEVAQQAAQAQAQRSKGPVSVEPADLNSPEIAPLLDLNHKRSDSDYIGNHECVDLTKNFSRMGDVSAGHQWYPGEKVSDAKDLKEGTAIANFNDKGRFPDKHTYNSGIYLGPGVNGSIWILDQWPGNSPRAREVHLDSRREPADNAGAYRVILLGPWR